jgi:hypothetical protein
MHITEKIQKQCTLTSSHNKMLVYTAQATVCTRMCGAFTVIKALQLLQRTAETYNFATSSNTVVRLHYCSSKVQLNSEHYVLVAASSCIVSLQCIELIGVALHCTSS